MVNQVPLASYPIGSPADLEEIRYGPNVPGEHELKLLGPLQGRRVLVLGCGAGVLPIVLTRMGAKAIVVDPDEANLARTGELATEHGHRIELHHADLAELAFVRGDSIHLTVSIFGLAGVDDLPRLFRQVHRVLTPDSPVVFSLPHPAFSMLVGDGGDGSRIARSYFDDEPTVWTFENRSGRDRTHTTAQVFLALNRAGFVTDTLLEPEPSRPGDRDPQWSDSMRMVPSTLVIRARKRGI